jgi:ATP-dependent Clp protease ATP-binding subunit ClpC
MFERFTASARRTVVLAQEEARALHHNYVGTEHLLLALTINEGPAGQALKDLGVTHETAQAQVLELIREGVGSVAGHIPFLPAARLVLQNALRSALDYGVNYIDAGHVLHSLLIKDTSTVPVAEQTIVSCGATLDAVNHRLADLMTSRTRRKPGPRAPLRALRLTRRTITF